MESYQGTADYIALCFAPADKDTAEQITAALQEQRLRVWVNSRGCNPAKQKDLARLAACRTAVILISKEWLNTETCAEQLKQAAALDKQTVLLFTDGADLVGRDDLNAVISRSVRMLDYSPDAPAECIDEMTALECILDCKLADGEEPDNRKVGIFG